MRLYVEFHSSSEFTPGMGSVNIWAVYWGQYDIGVGDSILDSNYSFTSGGSWGNSSGMSGSISGSADSSGNFWKTLRTTHQVPYTPAYGSEHEVQVTGSHGGVEKVGNPGNNFVALLDQRFNYPGKPYSEPERPTIESMVYDPVAGTYTMTISGHQNNPALNRYWANTSWTVSRAGTWEETHNQPGNRSTFTWTVAEDSYFTFGAYASNSNQNTRNWRFSGTRYSRPKAPSGLAATRRAGARTTVDLSWTVNASYSGSTRILRWVNGDWQEVASTSGTANSWSGTFPLGSYPLFRVVTQAPDGIQSERSAAASPQDEYLAPLAPTNVVLAMTGETSAKVTFSGNQSNPFVDNYWDDLHWDMMTNSGSYAYQDSELNGDATSFTTDYALPLNSRFRARVYASNSAGNGAYGYSAYCYSKPPAPTSVVAERVGITDQVQITFASAAAYAGSHQLQRSVNGGPWVDRGAAVGAAVRLFSDTLELTSYAQYRVVTRTLAPAVPSDASAASASVPATGYEKDRIPGIDNIYLGTEKVFRVMANNQQIWLG